MIINNNTDETAFFTRLKIIDKQTKEIVLTVFFEENYLILFPGEKKRLEINLSHLTSEMKNNNLQLVLEPWNGAIIKKIYN